MTLLSRLTGALAPHLGPIVAADRAQAIASGHALGAALDPDELTALIDKARWVARAWGEPVPTTAECVAAALSVVVVLREHSEAHPWLVLGAEDATASPASSARWSVFASGARTPAKGPERAEREEREVLP